MLCLVLSFLFLYVASGITSPNYYKCIDISNNNGALVTRPLPWLQSRPSGDSQESEEITPWVNDSCNISSDCKISSADNHKICVNGRCACTLGYAPKFSIGIVEPQWDCEQEAGLGDTCSKKCRRPLTCAADTKIDLIQNSTLNFTFSNYSRLLELDKTENSDEKHCQCIAPYVKRSDDCYLDCREDEIYLDYKCKKRCGNDEISLDGACKKMASLGQPCQDRRQCKTPFSDCVDKRCQCIDDLIANIKENTCEPQNYSCPFGEALMDKSGSVLKCRPSQEFVQKVEQSWDWKKDHSTLQLSHLAQSNRSECPSDHFCMLTGFANLILLDTVSGHCCPKPKVTCPIGRPHYTLDCPEKFSFALANSTEYCNCPSETHFTYGYSLFWKFSAAVCCPKACPDGLVFANDSCYPIKKYGDKCDVDQQCGLEYPFSGMICRSACTCADGYTLTNGTDLIDRELLQKCKRKCGEHERESEKLGTCVWEVQAGDDCNPELSDRCPKRSSCSRATKKCTCHCGYFPVIGQCIETKPSCNFQNDTDKPTDIADFNITAFTFCQIPSKRSIGDAVEKCQRSQYCASYIDDFGVCCPRPTKVICPNGSEGKIECDPSVPNVCGKKHICWKYLEYVVAPDSPSDGHVCCPTVDS